MKSLLLLYSTDFLRWAFLFCVLLNQKKEEKENMYIREAYDDNRKRKEEGDLKSKQKQTKKKHHSPGFVFVRMFA